VGILVGLGDGEVGVREGEVEEDVGTASAGGEDIRSDDLADGGTEDLSTEVVDAEVAEGEPEGLTVLGGELAVDEAGVEDELPGEGNEEASDGGEEESLSGEPQLLEGGALDAFSDALVEGDEGESFEINIVTKLLRSSVVSVVLVSPPTARHTITETVNHFLQENVELDVRSEGPVTGLMHQPATAALEHTKDEEAWDGVTSLEHEEASSEKGDDFSDAVEGVERRPVEPTLLVEAAGHLDEVLRHGFVLAEFVGFVGGFDLLRGSRALGKGFEHLLGLRRAKMELFIGVSSITTFSEELDDGATRVSEAGNVVEETVDEDLVLLARSTSG